MNRAKITTCLPTSSWLRTRGLGKQGHLAWRSGAITELHPGLLSIMARARDRRWGQMSAKGSSSSDRNLFSASSFLLSYSSHTSLRMRMGRSWGTSWPKCESPEAERQDWCLTCGLGRRDTNICTCLMEAAWVDFFFFSF